MKDILYSIIIPHKNIPELLQRCLNSIPEREDIEVIVVDDNSDPMYLNPEIFPGNDCPGRTFLFTKEGRGAGYARNVGMQHARGKWLLFADADDQYNEGFLEALDRHKNSEADVIYFFVTYMSCSEEISTREKTNYQHDLVHSFLMNPEDGNVVDALIMQCWEPWNKMFRRDFILVHQFLFEEISIGNDAMFVLNAGLAGKIDADEFPLYIHWMDRQGSITSMRSVNTLLVEYDLFLRINLLFKSYKKNKRFYVKLDFIFCMLVKQNRSLWWKCICLAYKYHQLNFVLCSLFRVIVKKRLKWIMP